MLAYFVSYPDGLRDPVPHHTQRDAIESVCATMAWDFFELSAPVEGTVHLFASTEEQTNDPHGLLAPTISRDDNYDRPT